MPKLLGKVSEENLNRLQKTQENIKRLKMQQEHVQEKLEFQKEASDLWIENINLKMSIENLLREATFKEIKGQFKLEDLSNIVIRENGEIVDNTDISDTIPPEETKMLPESPPASPSEPESVK